MLKAKPDLDVVAAPSIIMRYLSMNTQQKPFDNPKVRQAIDLRDQQGGARQDRVQRLRHAGRWRRARRRRVRGEARRLALRCGQGEEAPERSGLPERLRDRALVGVQPQHRAEGHPVRCSSSCSRSASRPRSPCSKPASAWRRSKAGRTRRPRRCGCTTSAGRRPPAKPTGRFGRCSVRDSWPPKLFNTAYYKSARVDGDLKGALLTTDKTEKAKLYKDAQETVYQDAPWVAAGHRKAAVGAQQEADRGLCHARRVVQFHRHRPALAAPARVRTALRPTPGRRARSAPASDRPPASRCTMLQYLIRRLLGLIPTLLLVGMLVFLFVHLLPGDPARLAAGPDADPGDGCAGAPGPRPRPAAARTVRAFFRRRAARRFRPLAAHQAPGKHRDRRALLADVLADASPAWLGRWSSAWRSASSPPSGAIAGPTAWA